VYQYFNIHSILGGANGQFLDNDTGVQISGFAGEVIRSYSLIFATGPRARALYRDKERTAARSGARGADQLLDEVCGFHTARWGLKAWEPPLRPIDPSLGFPILVAFCVCRGISTLDNHVESDDFTTISGTHIIGTRSGRCNILVMLSFVRTCFSVLQAIYTIKAYKQSRP
jgi:hypothetical protein